MKGGETMNANLLRGAIAVAGMNVEAVAKKMNISHMAFYNKLNGATEFNRAEMSSIKKILKLNNTEFIKIFFDH